MRRLGATTKAFAPMMIAPDFVPRFRGDVVAIPVQNETILYEKDTGRIHQLDPIATLVSGCFDGHTSIATMIDELVEAFGADRATVETDVLELARRLGKLGLLGGVQDDESGEETMVD